MLTLFTNRYQDFRPDQGVPVRITRGAPRFRLPYSLKHSVRGLAPRREYFSKPLADFTTAYRSDLDRLGAQEVADVLHGIAQAEGDHRLVLLCFEDLADPRLWCHRRVFAAWWRDSTGEEVRELGPMAEQYEQDTLM